MFKLLTSDQIQAIDYASSQMLEQVGVIVDNDNALKLLADAGANVDFSKRKARIPSYLIKEGVKKVPKKVRLYGIKSKFDLVYEEGKTYAHTTGGCSQILDLERGTIREASKGDLEKAVKIIDALDNIHINRPCVYPKDFPPEARDIHTMACMLENAEKHCNINTYGSTNLNYIIRLASAVVGSDEDLRKKPIIDGLMGPTKPLQYSNEDVNILSGYAKYGLPISISPDPMTGATTTITLAGALAHQNASVLAGILMVQLINPRNPVLYTSRVLTMDMRSGDILAGAIEVGIMSVGIVQLAKYYGIPSDVYGLGTSSKTLGEQTAFEKALNGLLPALAGANCISGAGSLESALTFSLEQLVIDNEILSMIFRSIQGINVEDDTLALEVIAKAGPEGFFLKSPHTREHLKKEHFIPKLASRAILEKMGAKNIIEAAKIEVKKILSEHQVTPLDKDIKHKFEKILKEADKKLIK